MPLPLSFRPCNRRTAMFLGGGGLVATLALPKTRATQAQERSTLDANKALVRRVFEEAVNGGNTSIIDELYAPTFVDPTRAARHFPHLAGMPVSIDEFRALFPTISATIDDIIAEGDLVATRVTWQREPSPVGNQIEWRTMHLSRIVNERIIEEWSTGWDWLELRVRRSSPQLNPLITP